MSSQSASRGTGNPGRVLFVGAGPGDPDLLTRSAVRALQGARSVLVDDEELRALAVECGLPADAQHPGPPRIVSVADLPQAREGVFGFLAEAAAQGDVVRLVPGDPFLDGDCAADVERCLAAGLPVEVVPGVSSMTAVPEYAGVSLAGEVQLVGHTGPLADDASWAPQGSLVVRCLAGALPDVQQRALAAGRAPDEPALLTVEGGSTRQSSTATTLGQLTRCARTLDAGRVVHVVLGEALAAARPGALDWFESKPLFGWRVLVPRTKDQAGEMVARLHEYGAHAVEVPTIQVEPPRTPQQMDKAIRGLVEGSYEWVAFTSVNAVRAVREKFEALGLDARAFSGLRIAAVGSATARSLRAWGLVPDLVPSKEQSAAGLAAEFPVHDELLDPINRVFLPRADIATEVLVEGLVALGWEVDDVVAYRTVRAAPPAVEVREAIKTGKFDAALFTSSSTVRNLVGIAGKPHVHTVVAAIGPQTAGTCEEHALRVDVVAEQPGAVELVDALARFAVERRAELLAESRPVTRPSETRRRRRTTPRMDG